MQTFYKICLILMIVGGINWGLVGLFQFDFVGWLLGGSASIWSRIVFTLVGIAALFIILAFILIMYSPRKPRNNRTAAAQWRAAAVL